MPFGAAFVNVIQGEKLMTGLAERIRTMQPSENQVGLFWLGQAGFVLKSPGGTVLFVDAYLSHSVERLFGSQWKRIMPPPLSAAEVDCDWFISTHEHDDHLDVDSIPEISRNPRVKFAGPQECARYYSTVGITNDRWIELHPGQKAQFGEFTCQVVFADHGDLAPDAVGLVIEYAGLRIYHTGDTAFRPEQMCEAIAWQPQIILPCINGAYGNMNSETAASLVQLTGARMVIPTHFWTFVEHGGDPWQFQKCCQVAAPKAQVRWLTQGEGILVCAADLVH
jgi:L-ascorbate 6-phosphate lactonase